MTIDLTNKEGLEEQLEEWDIHARLLRGQIHPLQEGLDQAESNIKLLKIALGVLNEREERDERRGTNGKKLH